MPRLPRYALPGQPQHVIHRGNNRQRIFRAEDDYRRLLQVLEEAAEAHACDIHAYVLMPNHIHLLATPRRAESLPKLFQQLGRKYVQYFNRRHRRTGTLWEGRYRATVIDSERYFLTCARYIELNPVRAGLVSDPAGYRWSSYRTNAGGEVDPLVTEHPLYRALGNSLDARRSAYRALFRTAIDLETLEDIREATNKAWALGSERFKTEVAGLSGRRAEPLPRGRPKSEARTNRR